MISEDILVQGNKNRNISNGYDNLSLPRFRWYNYKEGFSPNLVYNAITELGLGKNDLILDPFNGNGTVTLAASISNINSIGIEVNPFVAFMSKVKLHNLSKSSLTNYSTLIKDYANQGMDTYLTSYSTFSEKTGKNKWLFNEDVLKSFEGGMLALQKLPLKSQNLLKLALIGAAMDNCNAIKDGKCLKYRSNWENRKFNKDSFLVSFNNRLSVIADDLETLILKKQAKIINADSRKVIKSLNLKFKLCITSPPYLNSFDYTDIYRPELFLGKFINSSEELRDLRYRTLRSHISIKSSELIHQDFGDIYKTTISKFNHSEDLWCKQIPLMIHSYFEDLQSILESLFSKALQGAELWLIVANSVYVKVEIPVDLILAELGNRKGWRLKRIEVLRYINRRKTKYDGGISKVRESLIVFYKT